MVRPVNVGRGKVGWALENAEALHARAPDSYRIPSLERRTSLQVGERAKLEFRFMTASEGEPAVFHERMWCTIRETAGGSYVGTLDSEPLTPGVLKPGDRVEFGPENVVAVLIRISDRRHPDHTGGDGKSRQPPGRGGDTAFVDSFLEALGGTRLVCDSCNAPEFFD